MRTRLEKLDSTERAVVNVQSSEPLGDFGGQLQQPFVGAIGVGTEAGTIHWALRFNIQLRRVTTAREYIEYYEDRTKETHHVGFDKRPLSYNSTV